MKFVTRKPKQGQRQKPTHLDKLPRLTEQMLQVETESFEIEDLVDLGQTPASRPGEGDGGTFPPS